MKKKLEVQFLSNQILKDKIEKNQFKKGQINQQSRPGQIMLAFLKSKKNMSFGSLTQLCSISLVNLVI